MGLVCLVPHARDENAAQFLLASIQSALGSRIEQIVFVQENESAAALARSLYLEHPTIKVNVVSIPAGHPEAAAWAADEARAAIGFTEAHYDQAGVRREPRLRVQWPESNSTTHPLTGKDLLLVTRRRQRHRRRIRFCRSPAAPAVAWPSSDAQSRPNDRDLAANLLFVSPMPAFITAIFSADIRDAKMTAEALREIETLHGHGYGDTARRGHQRSLPGGGDHSRRSSAATLAPRLTGLRNLLAHLDSGNLRLLITFGSIIGRTGLHGESHYGLANDWLRQEVEQWQAGHPGCRCLNLEWSVWAGAGMGERLGVLESLALQGIAPLPLDEAVEQLMNMISSSDARVFFHHHRTLRRSADPAIRPTRAAAAFAFSNVRSFIIRVSS